MANNVTIKGIKTGTTTITASYTDGGVTKTSSVNFTVSKATGYLTATTTNKTYNGSAQTIASIATNSGTYYFGLGSSTASGPSSWGNANTALQATSAGTYYVWAKCDASTNYNAVDAKYIGTVTISQRTVTVTAPTVQSNTIKYTGSAQALLSGNGSASAGGTMYYYCSTSSTTPTFSTTTWSTTAPSKADVGTYYIWYYVYISDRSNNVAGTNVESVKSLGSKAIEKRNGAAPTFAASSVTAKCAQGSSASTSNASNAGAFDAATAGHIGSITYAIQSVVLNGSSTTLSGWTMTSTTSRIITVPANTLPGTYKVTVRATEAATTTDTSSYTDAVITVTLSKGDQTLNLDKTTLSLTVPNTGTIKASGYVGTLAVTSGTPAVATASNAATSTITAVGSGNASNNTGTSTITFTAAATDYLNTVSKTATVTVTRRTGAAPTFNDASVSATLVQAGSARTTSAFNAATAGHSGSITYSLGTVTKSGSSTSLTGWTIDGTNRKINVPANTAYGTYYATVTANEAATTSDTASSKNATITITLSRGTQTLTLDKDTLTLTVGGSTGTIKASGYSGTLTVTSGTPAVATASNAATSTITAVSGGTSTITFTAAATNYVDSVSKTATVTVNKRTGAEPTFSASTVTATCSQDQSAKTTSAFNAATAGHGGSITYTIVSVTNSGGTTLSNWTINSTNRTIGIPANTIAGTYTVVVKASEAATSTDTASEKNATITVTLSKGTQSLTLTGNPSNYTSTYNSGGTITASGHAGTISATSGTTGVATVSASGSVVTVTCVKAGTSVISVTAAANNYVDSVTKTQTWTINKAGRSGVVKSTGDVTSMTYGTTLQMSVTGNTESGGITWGVTPGTGTATISSSGVLTATKPGTVTVTASVAATTNYNAYTPTSKTITINKATLTVTEVNYSGTWDNSSHSSSVKVTKSDWDGKTIVSGTSTSYGTTVTSNGAANTTYNLKTATDYTASTTIYYKVTGGTYYNDYEDSVTFAITKANSTLPTNWKGDSKAYHNTATLTATGYSGGTLKYRYDVNNGTSWTETTTAPTRTAVGSTAVQVMVVGDSNHNNSAWSSTVTLTITQVGDARMEVTTTNRTYTGSPQVIASQTSESAEGIATYYLGYYKSSSEATSESQITWGSANSSISVTNAGTYQVYYKFTSDGNHSNNKDWTLVGAVTMSKASRSGAVSCNNTTYPNTVTATVSGNSESGTVTWGITAGTGTATINSSGVVTPTQAGTVTITASVAATENYLAYTATSKEITISKGTGVISYSTSNPAAKYCTSTANPASATDENKTFTIATASASSSTNTGATISYSINQSGWSISSDGKTVTVPADTAAGTYNITVTASVAATTNYDSASSQKSVKIILNANALEGIVLTLGTNSIAYNSTTTGTVVATYTNGQTKDVTTGATYSSNPTDIVTITK